MVQRKKKKKREKIYFFIKKRKEKFYLQFTYLQNSPYPNVRLKTFILFLILLFTFYLINGDL